MSPASALSTSATVDLIVSHWATHTPDRIAISDRGRLVSWRELDRLIVETADIFDRRGIRAGDRVLAVCENALESIVIYFALLRLLAWPVLVNAKLSSREIDEIREHCSARTTIYTVAASRPARKLMEGRAASVLTVAGAEIAMEALSQEAQPEPIGDNPGERVAALIYTSGTTGRPKGVMLSHRNLLSVAEASSAVRQMDASDCVYAVLPLTHILGLTGVVISTLLCGGQLRLAGRFDPADVLSAIRGESVSLVIATPSFYALVSEYLERKKDLPMQNQSLRLISSAGAPLDLATKLAAERALGLTLHNGYGITECAPTIALTRIGAPRSDCSVGSPIPGVEIQIRNPEGAPVAEGDVGELFVRGPGVMKGYYRAADETAQAIDGEGWFRTGDLARSETGNFFIVGRAKEMIIRFGFNVYPAEVEGVLNTHPALAGSAVVGRKGREGEEVVAFVERRAGVEVTATEIAQFGARNLAPYKVPSEIVIMDALPKSPAGKILKSALLEHVSQ
jgi:acyl-CoA synthetase (AMP-forming)/AMP-acid ligase II